VLDLAASVRALAHGSHVDLPQERRCIGGDGKALPSPYFGQIRIMLTGPVHVYAA
jgi:hypothetical protein